MRGIYDYRGECFGYTANGKIYDLDGRLAGYLTLQAVTTLKGQFMWHVSGDGLYDKHWVSIGYIGGARKDNDDD
jgi:hypothetical protein